MTTNEFALPKIESQPVMLLAATAAVTFLVAAALGAEVGAAVRAVWSEIDASFNARDAERFSRLFTDDASFVRVKRRQALESRAEIFEEFARRFPGFSPDVHHHTDIRRVFTVAPGVLAADGIVDILRINPDAETQPEVLRTFAISVIMLQGSDALRVRSLRVYELPTELVSAPASRN